MAGFGFLGKVRDRELELKLLAWGPDEVAMGQIQRL